MLCLLRFHRETRSFPFEQVLLDLLLLLHLLLDLCLLVGLVVFLHVAELVLALDLEDRGTLVDVVSLRLDPLQFVLHHLVYKLRPIFLVATRGVRVFVLSELFLLVEVLGKDGKEGNSLYGLYFGVRQDHH